MKHLVYAACLFALATPAMAHAEDSIFDSYEAMRRDMDALVSQRNIEDLMIRFGGADEMTIEQLRTLDAQVEQVYPQDFTNVAVMRRVSHGDFHQELLAYWTGTAYIYTYVFYHVVDDHVVAINFRFNSDFSKLNALF